MGRKPAQLVAFQTTAPALVAISMLHTHFGANCLEHLFALEVFGALPSSQGRRKNDMILTVIIDCIY